MRHQNNPPTRNLMSIKYIINFKNEIDKTLCPSASPKNRAIESQSTKFTPQSSIQKKNGVPL